MTYQVGGLVQAVDHNNRLAIINNVWSTGSASYGWGQASLGTVTVGELVEAGLAGSPVEWASLVTTLNNISTHELGSSAGITVPVTYDLITWINTFDSNMNTLCDVGGSTENRFGNYAVFDDQTVSTSNYSQTWGNPSKPQIQNVASIVWGTSDQARYFFNAGGRVNLSISYSGSGSPQDANWATVCSNAGTMWVQANSSGGTASNGFGYWQSAGRMYSASGSGAYSSNTLTVDVSGQGTSQLQFTTTFRDNHTNIYSDIVTGTFTISILVRRPPMRGLLSNSWGLGTVSFSGAGWSGGSTPVVTITLSPSTLPAGNVGTGYTQTITASGGTGPYTYAVVTGVLPSGLSLSSGGVISGTPLTAAVYSIAIQATDSLGNTGSQPYTLTIAAPAVTITLSPSTLPSGNVGTAYNQTITASGGTGPYTYTVISGTLPSGLSLSSGGVISGTPTTASNYSFTVRATDSLGSTGTRAYSVTIDSAIIPTSVLFRVLALEGVGVWQPISTVYNENADNNPNNLSEVDFPITLYLSPTSLPNGQVSTAYSQTVTASGGTAPYTYSLIAGSLPSGLSLSSGGVISGTPTTASSYSFTIGATDILGSTGTRAYSVTIAAAPLVVGQAYGGGYFAGVYCAGGDGVPTHNLIVAPFSSGILPGAMNNFIVSGYEGAAAWQTSAAIYDGYNTTQATPNGFAAVTQIKNLTIGGYTDWYVPSIAELQIAYYNLKSTPGANNIFSPNLGAVSRPNTGTAGNKWAYPIQLNNYQNLVPSQTTATDFQGQNSQSFTGLIDAYNGIYGLDYISCTSYNLYAQYQVDFIDGTCSGTNALSNATQGYIRAFRKVPI